MALPDVRRVPIRHSSLPGTVAVAYDAQYRRYARADTEGSSASAASPTTGRSGASTRAHSLEKYLYFSPDDRFLLGLADGFTLRVWRVADGQPVLRGRAPRVPGACVQPGWPDAGGRPARVGPLLRSGDGAANPIAGACPRGPARWRFTRTAASWPSGTSIRASLPCTTRRAGPSSRTCPSGRCASRSSPGIRTGSAWPSRVPTRGSRSGTWPANRKVATLEGHVQVVTELTFHPEGGLLASHSWDGVLRLWDPSTGRPLLQLPLTVADRPRFSDDGRWLGAVPHGEQAELLEVTPSREYRTLVSSAAYRRARLQPRRLQPGRSPAGRGHGRRHPSVGPAQRPGARRAARRDHLCFLRRRGARRRRPRHVPQPARGAPDLRSGRPAALAAHGRRSGGSAVCVSARRGDCPPWLGPGSRAARTAARWGW